MSQTETENRRLDAALSEFFERKRVEFYDWVSQMVKREVTEQLGRNQPTTRRLQK